MLKEFLEEALEAEMEEHLSKERAQGNKRNGKGSKTVKSSSGELEIQTPQDRHSSFEPRSEEHTSELQSRENLVCRLLLEKKKKKKIHKKISHKNDTEEPGRGGR